MKKPKKNKFDTVHEVTKIIAESIPVLSALSKLKTLYSPIGLEKRNIVFWDHVGKTLEALPETVVKIIIEYSESEEGQTLLLKTMRAVYLTHKLEKYSMLRNVLLNTALDDAVSFDYKEICIELISELEPADVLLLKEFNQNLSDFAELDSYEKIFKLCVSHGLRFDKDSFYLSLMKLKNKSLIRLSEGIDGFNDVYESVNLVGENDNKMPRLKITSLASKFIEYLEDLKA